MKKKSFYLFAMMIVALCVGFTSCGDDDDEPGGKPGTEENSGISGSIVGTWQFISFEEHYSDGEVYTYSYEEDNDLIYQFYNADGTAGTCQYLHGQWYTIPYTYSIDGDILKADVEDDIQEAKILTLNSTSLVIRVEESDSYLIETYKRVSDSVIAGAK